MRYVRTRENTSVCIPYLCERRNSSRHPKAICHISFRSGVERGEEKIFVTVINGPVESFESVDLGLYQTPRRVRGVFFGA